MGRGGSCSFHRNIGWAAAHLHQFAFTMISEVLMKRARFALANMSEMNTKLVKDSRVVSALSFLRTWAVFPMVACLLAIGLPNHVARATASHQQTVFPADTPP